MKKLFILFFIIAFFFTSNANSQTTQTPESLRNEAFTKVKIGTELMRKASDLLNSKINEATLKAGITLYAQAGQMFQEAYSILTYLGEDYVSSQDLEGTSNAMELCMKAIKGIKDKILQEQQQV